MNRPSVFHIHLSISRFWLLFGFISGPQVRISHKAEWPCIKCMHFSILSISLLCLLSLCFLEDLCTAKDYSLSNLPFSSHQMFFFNENISRYYFHTLTSAPNRWPIHPSFRQHPEIMIPKLEYNLLFRIRRTYRPKKSLMEEGRRARTAGSRTASRSFYAHSHGHAPTPHLAILLLLRFATIWITTLK